MNYTENRLFNIGFILIILAGGVVTLIKQEQVQFLAAVGAAAGAIVMLYGLRQHRKQHKL